MRFEDIPKKFINFENIVKRAKSTIETDKILEGDFSELYGEEQVRRDRAEVERLLKEFESSNSPQEKEAKKLATVFEAILGEQSELSEWLGSQVTTINSSDFDDIKNGVDMIVEVNGEMGSTSHMGLAIDATYSSNLTSKFERIKSNIDKGSLATIKYFSSPNKDFMEQLRQVPRVVVGADADTIDELIEMWVTGRKKELGEHPIQFQIIDLIITQLEAFKDYSKKIDNNELVNKFDGFIKIFVEILNDRNEVVKDSGKRDSMFNTIIKELDSVIE